MLRGKRVEVSDGDPGRTASIFMFAADVNSRTVSDLASQL